MKIAIFFTSIVLVTSAHLADVSISMGISNMIVDMPKADNKPSKGTIWGMAMANSATDEKKDEDELLPVNYIQHSCHRVLNRDKPVSDYALKIANCELEIRIQPIKTEQFKIKFLIV